MRRIALIGAGVVGSSWSLLFAREGFEVGRRATSVCASGRKLADEYNQRLARNLNPPT